MDKALVTEQYLEDIADAIRDRTGSTDTYKVSEMAPAIMNMAPQSDVMYKSVYDTDGDGIVDNAEKVNNHTVDKDVPSDAKFTDTVYDDTQIKNSIGTLSNLNTTEKSNLVGAVNEVDSDIQTLTNQLDNLTDTISDTDTYVFRRGKGSLSDMELTGGTLAWNQLVQNGNKNWTVNSGENVRHLLNDSCLANHVYLVFITQDITLTSVLRNTLYYNYGTTYDYQNSSENYHLSHGFHQWIYKPLNDGGFYFWCNNPDANVYYDKAQLFDLTAMFGTEIADYIYSLEQSTAGAGVTWFRQYFPKSYYAYNAGGLESVKPSGRKVVGFNQWDEEWESGWINDAGNLVTGANIRSKNYTRVFPNTDYALTCLFGELLFRVCFYDMDKNFIRRTENTVSRFTTPNNCYYIKITGAALYGTTYRNDVCINLSDPDKNGTYEPYDSTEYTMPQIDLRGIPKLVDGKLSYDGDIYDADGRITRKYGIVDLGTLNWQYSSVSENFYVNGVNSWIKLPTVMSDAFNGICKKYNTISYSASNGQNVDKAIFTSWTTATYKYLYVRDNAYTDAATFKTAMSGVYLVYELETPTTEDAPVFVNPQRSFIDGTEEWLDDRDVTVPVGNNSTYYLNDTYPPIAKYADGVGKQNKVYIDEKSDKTDLTSIEATGTTNNTGSTIAKGKYFYLNGKLCRALADISSNATLTKNTNYSEVNLGILDVLSNISANYQSVKILHNIPRLVPKDITSYISDGTFWKRLNGTDGFELFEDLYVGDYWQMTEAISAYNQDSTYQLTGSKYVTIAGIDMHYGDGDGDDSVSAITYHHVDMVPGQGLGGTQHFGRSRMNPTNTTVGGYVGSEMHTTTIGAVTTTGKRASADSTATINEQLYAEFGSHLKKQRCLLSTAMDSARYNRFGQAGGASSNSAWTTVQAVLMTEIECYGSIVWSSSGYDTGNSNKQLPLFANAKQAMNNRTAYYWLRDVASSAYFCYCYDYGYAYFNNASFAYICVRPRFILA